MPTAVNRLLIGQHGPFADSVAKVRRYARHDRTLVLLGPSGTGKTSLANLAHAESKRANGPFVPVNLAGLDDAMASTELFGHERGAFTSAYYQHVGVFEKANGGTLFLDEFAKTSRAIQHKLLDVLDHHRIRRVGAARDIPVDVRIIFAANEPLEELVAAGTLLEEFEARLGLLRVRLPSLRDRVGEIPQLLAHFIHTHAPDNGYPSRPPQPTPELVRVLQRYDWPKNVRQLENLTIRLLEDAEGAMELSADLLIDDIAEFRSTEPGTSADNETRRARVALAIRRSGGNRSLAAKELGCSRSTLYRWIDELQIAISTEAPVES